MYENVARSVEDVLIGMRQGKERGDYIIFQCPAHDDQHPSARYNRKLMVWNCHCGTNGGVLDLAHRVGVHVEKQERVIAQVYPYRDEQGVTLYEKVRFEPKSFAMRQTTGEWGIGNTRRVLYNLDKITEFDGTDLIFIVEGEKDAEALTNLGLLATTTYDGADSRVENGFHVPGMKKWHKEYSDSIRHINTIAIIPDDDAPGIAHAYSVLAGLKRDGIKAKIIHPKNMPDGGDISDWLAHGGTAQELIDLALSSERDGYVAVEDIDTAISMGTIPTGYRDLDAVLRGGLRPGQLIIIAARPSVGKSSLACGWAYNVTRQGRKVLLFSLEMSEQELADKIAAHGEYERNSIFIDQSMSYTVEQMADRAKYISEQEGVDLIIIDYLQLMDGTGNRVSDLSHISRRLKQLAREMDVPVVALSQLNREVEHREDHRPRLSDLRESGSIEQDADIVIFLTREEMHDRETSLRGIATAMVAKQRQGPRADVPLGFHGPTTCFYDLATAEEDN
jgi:KaiC/GvpD/RAD55 family RecA-like ATPase